MCTHCLNSLLIFCFVSLFWVVGFFPLLRMILLVVAMVILIDFFLLFCSLSEEKPFFIPILIMVEQMLILTSIQFYNVAPSSIQCFVHIPKFLLQLTLAYTSWIISKERPFLCIHTGKKCLSGLRAIFIFNCNYVNTFSVWAEQMLFPIISLQCAKANILLLTCSCNHLTVPCHTLEISLSFTIKYWF